MVLPFAYAFIILLFNAGGAARGQQKSGMASTYDSLLASRVGALGPWQLAVFVVVGFCTAGPLLQFQQLALTVPPHFCAQPRLEEAGWSREAIQNRTVPPKKEGGFESCLQYNLSLER